MFRMLIHPSSGACDLFIEFFHGFYCSDVVWLGWCGIRVQAEAIASACIRNKTRDIKLVFLYSTIKIMHGPINIRFLRYILISWNMADQFQLTGGPHN